MVAERRFGPLVAVLFGVVGVLLVRLFQVQVLEHTIWAAEAESLVKSSQVLPSHRGRLLDRHGRVLAEDQDVWRVDVVYRDFRRGHPLGVVAHARSALEMRAVPLAETLASLDPWARELVSLSPAEIDRFARGEALATAPLSAGEAVDPARDMRASRASDLRFYVGALLAPSEAERREIRKAEREDPPSARAYVEIVAGMRKTPPETLLAELSTDLSRERARLARLAALLPVSPAAAPGGSPPSVETLLAELEAARARFENAAADALFEEAAGFSPGRVSTASLLRVFELDWIARILRWDPERARSWAQSRRSSLERDLLEVVAPRILARAGLGEEAQVAERVLDGLAAFYEPGEVSGAQESRSWRDQDDACVLAEIDSLFDLPRRPRWDGEDRPALPLFDQDVREASEEFDDPWLTLGTLGELAGATLEVPGKKPGDPATLVRNAREWAGRLRAIAERDPRLEGESARGALLAILRAFEARLLQASDAGFEACLAAASAGDAVAGPLPFSRERLERALQKERFLLKDLASRPARLAPRASYPLVHLLERRADHYRGFEVAPATRRTLSSRDAQGVPIAGMLLGGVRGLSLREVMANEESVRKLRSGEWDDDEFADVAVAILRADERTGSHGLEGYFDPELRGRNGWLETSGLEEGPTPGVLRAAVDGKDVTLTLDLDLQRAAEETLAHPQVPSDPITDRGWFEHPVGAIVLITPDGEVLAAASEPSRSGLTAAPGRDLERTFVRERTLTRPKFTPPGSVIKMFVAAYALDRLGLDPEAARFECEPLPDGGSGYATMHCHGAHGRTDLAQALAMSCNAAFAQIGERYPPEALIDMAATFGFGMPTGIRQFEGEGGPRRPGLLEQATLAHAKELPRNLSEAAERMRFANGLGRIEATPMQVARAVAGLLTGKLPEIRIARAIDGVSVAKEASDLPIGPRAREIVCRHLEAVVTDPRGSAHNKGLDRASLGFSFACKTGSADKRAMPAELGGSEELVKGQRRMIKQTWVAGWFPVEEPKAILVVMLHDVTETSSHTSVYVAAQFLQSAAVKRFVEGRGPEDAEPAPGEPAPGETRAVEASSKTEEEQ